MKPLRTVQIKQEEVRSTIGTA